MLVLPYSISSAPRNMAIDLALLEDWQEAPRPRLRAYGWLEPACTMGQSQQWKAISRMVEPECALIRRVTGGGLVDHRADWTWALVIPTTHQHYRSPAHTVYELAHAAIAEALSDFGVMSTQQPCLRTCATNSETALNSTSQKQQNISKVCFERAEVADIITEDGQKIAGAAMKRNRAGLLTQGSLSLLTANLREAVLGLFYERVQIHLSRIMELGSPEKADFALREEAIARHETMFSNPEWNQRR